LPAPSGTGQSAGDPHVAIFVLSPRGQQGWSIRALPWATVPQSVPFSKGEAPLITTAGLLYVPFVGPVYGPGQNNGVEVVSPAGVPLRRLLPGWSCTIAVAPDGILYAVGGDSQGHTAVLASRADGTIWWSDPASYEQWGSLLIGQHGMVYASVGSGYGASDTGEVLAYMRTGRLAWRFSATAGMAALAQRADGTLLLADARGLSAIGPRGTRRWYRPLGETQPSSWLPPSLVVDSLGRAYVGRSDGMIRAIAPDRRLLWSLRAGGPADGSAVPMIALGPGGLLLVTGTDGVLRVYR
jgi:outer membrane protein assembly factor BamB